VLYEEPHNTVHSLLIAAVERISRLSGCDGGLQSPQGVFGQKDEPLQPAVANPNETGYV